MPLLSCFSPCGALALSSKPPVGRSIYDTRVRNLGGNFDLTAGTHVEATAFAQSMGEGGAIAFVRRGGDQMLPSRLYECLPTREAEYGVSPTASDTIAERRAAVAARKLLPGGCTYGNVYEALRTLLGDDFIAYRVTKPAEVVTYPSACGDQPMNLQPPEVPRKLGTLGGPVAVGSHTVSFTLLDVPVDPSKPATSSVLVGDVLVVDPGKLGLEDRVTVTAATGSTLTATFTKPHDTGAPWTTAPFPRWQSTQRIVTVVVSASASVDADKRRQVDELMQRMMRDVTTWQIVEGTSSSTAGPFKVGEGLIGITPIVALSLP